MTTPPTPVQYLDAVRRDGERLADLAAGRLAASVPPCPGWTVRDLVAHTGSVHRHKAAIIRHGGTAPTRIAHQDAPAEGLLAWYREGLADLLVVLDTDPEQPAYSWAGDHRVAFWQRRMAHETAIHRADAEAAAGDPTPLTPPELAADGIDEVLACCIVTPEEASYVGPDASTASSPSSSAPAEGPEGSVHLHCTDTDGEWIVRLRRGAGGMVERGHERCDLALRGTASDLDLFLWGRPTLAEIEKLGDHTLLAGLRAFLDTT